MIRRALIGLTVIPLLLALPASAADLHARFSCAKRFKDQDSPSTIADIGEIEIVNDQLKAFYWESITYVKVFGIECNIDLNDGLQIEPMDESGDAWRITLKDGQKARARRGYEYEHGLNCSIRIERKGDRLHLRPSCPALCGARANFTELTLNLSSSECQYEE